MCAVEKQTDDSMAKAQTQGDFDVVFTGNDEANVEPE
jgi:hypothetical protein